MKKGITMTDLSGLMAPYFGEIQEAIDRVVRSGIYVGGREVSEFEEEWAGYLGVKHAIGTGNGTDALAVALRSLGIGSGDRVATVSLSAVATVAAIEMVGAFPVWVEVDFSTKTMSVDSLETVLESYSRTPTPVKAIVPVHLYGHPADMPQIMRLAGKYGCLVVEDCAQAHGASIGDGKCGSFGHMSAFSFYPTKNLGCLGDGGAVCTDDEDLATRARMIAQYGWKARNQSELPGMNSRLDPVQAAVLRVRLRNLDHENIRRRELAKRYSAALGITSLTLPDAAADCYHVFHLYAVQAVERDALMRHLSMDGIESQVHYPTPIHLQAAYKGRCLEGADDLSITESICSRVLSLPVNPSLSDGDVERVIASVTSFRF